ncbi:MAG: hypothetical protein J0M22_07625 [Gammaproteobacteria bacterium]|nr:hypothetical protein [Gammaproteobacteria bacterium]
MQAIEQLSREFRASISTSLDICQLLERGQANTPLADLFQQLQKNLGNKPLGITLIGLTPETRNAALKWLYGHNFAVFSLEVSQQIGLLEVQLKDQGYSLEKSTGERLEFDHWDDFMGAVHDAKLFAALPPNNADKGALKVGTQSATTARNLQVLIPESCEFIAKSPALLSRLLAESNLVMVAGSPDQQLSGTDQAVLAQLLDDMVACWPLLPVDELNPDTRFPEKGWWTQLKSAVTLSPTLLTTHVDAAIPTPLAEVSNDLRLGLQFALQSKRLHSITEAMTERYEQEVRQLQSRKSRESRRTDGPTTTLDYSFWSQIKTELGDEIQALQKDLQESSRRREVPTGTTHVSLKQLIDSIDYDGLDREDQYKMIKLSLSRKTQDDLTGFIQQQSKQQLRQDIESIQQRMQALLDRISEKLHKQTGALVGWQLPKLPDSQIWQDMQELISLELRYQGELPKRGFIDRLSEGRKSVMVVMMSVMLLGYVGMDLRSSPWLSYLVVPMFFGAIAYSFIGFRKDEEYRLDKELTRVREELLSAGRRTISDLNRLKQTKLNEFTDGLKKQWQQQLEQFGREQQSKQQAEQEQSASKAKARIGAIDSQLSELNSINSQVQKVTRDVQSLLEKTRQLLSQLNK